VKVETSIKKILLGRKNSFNLLSVYKELMSFFKTIFLWSPLWPEIWYSFLSLPRAGITAVDHHSWLINLSLNELKLATKFFFGENCSYNLLYFRFRHSYSFFKMN
jgi:hypothetical protein